MDKSLSLLLVDDSKQDAESIAAAFDRAGYGAYFEQVDGKDAFIDALANGKWDAVICDDSLPNCTIRSMLTCIRERDPGVPVIVVSDNRNVEAAVEAMRCGACDYVLKDRLERLVPALERCWGDAEERRERARAEKAVRESEERHLQVQKMESLGNLAGGIAHDFNNILAVINGYSELILNLPQADEQVKRFAEEINRGGERATKLVRQMLMFARKTNARFGTMQVNDVVDNICELLKETFPESIDIRRELDRSLSPIQADVQQVSQVVMNLAVNARDVMKATGGTLTFSSERLQASALPRKFSSSAEGDYVCIRVSDTGCGMDEEVRSRAFDPFFTTKDVGEGTGLGLAVVYGIMQTHCGYVDVESQPGKGAVFTVYFPTALSSGASSGDRGRSLEPTGGRETLLLVEDEVLVAEWLRWSLSEKGYEVIWAKNGLDALKIFEENEERIALILSDHGLPGISGWELFMKLKERNLKIPFVIATGYMDPHLKQSMLESGISDFLSKPFKRKTLLVNVRRLLDARHARVRD